MASELNAFLETLFLDGTFSDVLPKRQIPQEQLAPASTKRSLRNGVGGGEWRSGRAGKTELVVDDDGAERSQSECARQWRTGSGWIAHQSAQTDMACREEGSCGRGRESKGERQGKSTGMKGRVERRT
ncbi:hypothetical protein C8J57DRAFT_1244015 [Mycena rebaudengoi]|nr:hypothetical protein C8J57DRAFT_1244015 [Mycena rebaudengoi]